MGFRPLIDMNIEGAAEFNVVAQRKDCGAYNAIQNSKLGKKVLNRYKDILETEGKSLGNFIDTANGPHLPPPRGSPNHSILVISSHPGRHSRQVSQ